MLNNYLIPLIVLIILIHGLIHKISIYDEFISGAKEGLITTINIIPSLLALLLAVNVFKDSNILNLIKGSMKDIVTLAVLRPISGNASLVMLNNIYNTYGVDSFLSFLGSIIEGSTDTTIYVLALYFKSIGIKKTRYALLVGLFADICGICAAIIIGNLYF